MTSTARNLTLDLIEGKDFLQFLYCKRSHYLSVAVPQETDLPKPESNKPLAHSKKHHALLEDLGLEVTFFTREFTPKELTLVVYSKSYEPQQTQTDAQPWDSDWNEAWLAYVAAKELRLIVSHVEFHYVGSESPISKEVNLIPPLEAQKWVTELRDSLALKAMPDPLEDSPKCVRCRFVEVCLPMEMEKLKKGGVTESESEFEGLKRLYPLHPQKMPLHIREQGSYVSLKQGMVVIKSKRSDPTEVLLKDISSVLLHGAIQVTTPCLTALVESKVPVLFLTVGSWVKAVVCGFQHGYMPIRLAQAKLWEDDALKVSLSKKIVLQKIKNSINLLRRRSETNELIQIMNSLSKDLAGATTLSIVMGIEGAAAAAYFQQFKCHLSPQCEFDFNGRNRRPPLDPINAMLSYGYSLLLADCVVACLAAGLDPELGFFHSYRTGKPALALDIMEEFRAAVVDSLVLGLSNNRVFGKEDFLITELGCSFLPESKKRFIAAYEEKLNSEMVHPFFGYSVSFRRIIELQFRIFGLFLVQPETPYHPFRWR